MTLASGWRFGVLALLSAAIIACPPATITAPNDAQADGPAVDVPIAEDGPAVDRAPPVDARPPGDVPATPDGAVKDVPVDDVSIGPDDVPEMPDAPDPMDLPVGPDVPEFPDVPVPVDGVVLPDVPVPPTDVPSACGFAVQRALMLPTDRVMATLSGPSRVTAMCANSAGPDHAYTLHVDARTGVMLSTSDASFDTVLSVRRTCTDARSEFLCSDDVSGSNNSRVRAVLDPGDYFVLVDQFGDMAGMGGTYALNVSTYAPSANAVCTGAIALSATAPATGDSRNGGARSEACQNGSDGPQSFYTLTVPPGRRATVAATPGGAPAWRPVVRVLSTCASTTCLSNATAATAGAAASDAVDNRGTTPLNVVVSVAATSGGEGGPFSLSVAYSDVPPPPTNTTCAAVMGLTAPVTLRGQYSVLGTENATGTCLTTATGAVLYYRVTVPARQTLNIRVTPDSVMNPVVRVLGTCPATACLASFDGPGAGVVRTSTYANPATTDATVFLAIGGATNATNGHFDLELSLDRSYFETSIPAACDAMTGATPLMGLGGDDSHTDLLDLPFAFPFFGESQREYSVTSNGLIQLFPTLMGAGTNSFDNVTIPSASEPNGFIAALWDDLFPGMSGTVLARVIGTAPERRYTVQWTGFGFYGDNTARLTFQAKLFETSGAIELHYCTLTPGMMAPLATGSTATIGIEAPSGRSGRLHSFNTPMSISTATALRFAP